MAFSGSVFQPVTLADVVTQMVVPKAKHDVVSVMLLNVVMPSGLVISAPNAVVAQVDVPVALQSSTPVYLSNLMMYCLVLPCLDSFEVVLTTSGFCKCQNYNPEILALYLHYARLHVSIVLDILVQ